MTSPPETNADRSDEWAALRERYLIDPSERPDSSGRGLHHMALLSSDPSGAPIAGTEAALGTIAEFALPFASLGVEPGFRVTFVLTVREGGHVIESAPDQLPIVVEAPGPDVGVGFWSALPSIGRPAARFDRLNAWGFLPPPGPSPSIRRTPHIWMSAPPMPPPRVAPARHH